MKPVAFLLAALTVVLVAVVWLLIGEVPPDATGHPHPTVANMRIGGDGADRFLPLKGPALLLQSGTILAMTALIAMSLKPRRRRGVVTVMLLAIAALSLVVWFRIVADYESALPNGSVAFVLGFPLPSMWAVYAVWLGGLLLTLLYVLGFNRLVYTRDDREKFEALLRDIRDRKAG